MKLEIKNINKSFGGLKASDDITLSIKDKSLHSIIGPNGAGKTTLIKQIAGEIYPDSGNIYLNNQDITNYSDFNRASLGLFRTFQTSSLFDDLSVYDNLTLCIIAKQKKFFSFLKNIKNDKSINDEVIKYLEIFNFIEHKDKIVNSLAHGQKKELELAMALSMEAKILLLDEPTAGMGIKETKSFIKSIEKIKGKITIILIEHDMDVVFDLSDDISVLNLGSLLISGKAKEVMNDTKVNDIYLGHDIA
jgi:branched-chain amino acid transport system ATP-binding protein